MRWTVEYLMSIFFREKYKVGWGDAAKISQRLVGTNIQNRTPEDRDVWFRGIADKFTTLLDKRSRL